MPSGVGNDTNVTGTGIGTEQYIWSFYYGYYHQVYHPFTLVICIVGLLANVINIAVFTRKEMRNSLNFLLTALAFSDILFYLQRMSLTIIYFSCPSKNCYTTIFSLVWINGLYLTESTSLWLSEWLNVTVGAWRFIAVTWPLKAKRYFNGRRAKIAVCSIAISAFFGSLPVLSFIKTEERELDQKPVTILITRQFDGAKFIIVHYVFKAVICVAFTLPIPIAIGVTCSLIWNIRTAIKSRRLLNVITAKDSVPQNVHTTLMLTVMLIIFILTNTPSTILNISYYLKWFAVTKHRNLFLLLQEFDKMSTFFIYFAMSTKYRRTCRRIFTRTKPSTSAGNSDFSQGSQVKIVTVMDSTTI